MTSSLKGRKILLLGTGIWQEPYIKKAKELGLIVYATDWTKDTPGAKYADVFELIDLKDKELTLKFAKKNEIEAIFTSADIGVPTAAYVAESLSLPFHSQELAFQATNKFAMRSKAKEIGLPVPRFELVSDVNNLVIAAKKVGFPLIVKPIDAFASRGVRFVENTEHLPFAYNESKKESFSGELLLEEFMTGVESSVEVLVNDGEPIILGICDKVKSSLPYRFDLKLTYPGDFSDEQNKLIRDFINHLVEGYKIKNGIIHVEIMVNQSSVRLIEFGVRGCGTKVVTHLLPAMLDFDIVEYLLYLAFGIKREIKTLKQSSGILQFIMLENKKIKDMQGLNEARLTNGIIDLSIEKKIGDIVLEAKDGKGRPGYVLAVGSKKENAEQAINEALSKLRIKFFD